LRERLAATAQTAQIAGEQLRAELDQVCNKEEAGKNAGTAREKAARWEETVDLIKALSERQEPASDAAATDAAGAGHKAVKTFCQSSSKTGLAFLSRVRCLILETSVERLPSCVTWWF